jgi:tetratricopeptide (TPR) repeat protein
VDAAGAGVPGVTGPHRRSPILRRFWPDSLRPAHYVFAAVFLVRLIVLIRLASSPLLLPGGSDMQFYDNWAKQILHGHWTDHQAFYGLPLYPYVVALLYRLFGYSPFVPGFFQAMCDAGTAVLIYKIARRAAETAPRARTRVPLAVGLLAAAGWCLFVPAQAYSAVLMPASAGVFVFWLVVWQVLRSDAPLSARRCLFVGLLTGIAAMAVASALFLVVLLGLEIFVRRQSAPAKALVLILLGVVLGTSPCWLHNFVVARDRVFLSAHGGINLWLGNNPEATGYPSFPGLHAGQSDLLRESIEIAEAAAGRNLKRSEVSQYWSGKARNYIVTDPAGWVRLLARKAGNFWNAFEYDDVGVIGNLREHRILLPGLHFGLAAALGLAGLIFSWRRSPTVRWIAAVVALQMAALLPVFVTERYRLPVVPGLLILAALGLARLWENVARGLYRNVAVQVAVVGASTLFVSVPRNDPALWALDAYNTGRLALELNDLPRADRELQRAHDLAPGNAETNFALGNLRHAEGDPNAAKRCYEAALKADPKHKGALNNLGVVALDEKAPAVAAEYFRRSLALQPQNAKTEYLLAQALMALGDRAGAEAAVSRALKLAPDQPEFLALRDRFRETKP